MRRWTMGLLLVACACASASWESLNEEAKAASEAGEYEKAARLFERAAERGEPTQRIMSLNNLGELHRALERPLEAIEYYQRAIDVREAELGTSEELADSYASLALHVRPHDPARSSELTERAMALYEELYGEEDARVADALNNLGVLALQQGKLDAAEDYFKRAIEKVQLARGAGHISVAIAHANVAQLQVDRGDLEAAERSYLEALEIWRLTRGTEHPDYARAEGNLAELLRRQGEIETARERFEHAIEVLEASMADDDPRVADPLNNLALLHKERDELDRAQALYERAIERLERAYPDGHPDLAATIFNLGRLHADADRAPQALEAYDRAIAMLEGTAAVETLELVRTARARIEG